MRTSPLSAKDSVRAGSVTSCVFDATFRYLAKYALSDAERASRKKRERAEHKEVPLPVKIGQDVNPPLKKVPQMSAYEPRSRMSPAAPALRKGP